MRGTFIKAMVAIAIPNLISMRDSMTEQLRVAVIGASGYTGRRITPLAQPPPKGED